MSKLVFFLICTIAACNATTSISSQLIQVEQQVDAYFKGLRSLKSGFRQCDQNKESACGTFWISKMGNTPQAKVIYKSGTIDSILLKGKYLTVKYRNTGKVRTYSVLTTPIYAILTGQLSLSDYQYTVCENTDTSLSLQVDLPNKQGMLLNFSKNPINNKIQFLKAWVISDNNSFVAVELDIKTLHVNDALKVPSNIFTFA